MKLEKLVGERFRERPSDCIVDSHASIAICKECDYRANMEAAECIIHNRRDNVSEELTLVHTPNIHTIEEVCEFLHCGEKDSCKAVVYQRNSDDHYIVLFIRGDLEVNETKLTNYLGYEIHPAVIAEESGLNAGYIGPVNLKGDFTILFDRSLEEMNNLLYTILPIEQAKECF